MRRIIFPLILIIAGLAIAEAPAIPAEKDGRKAEMKKLLPLKVESYKAEGKEEFYDRQTTFRYMNGAAELYRSYGFKLLLVRRYTRPNDPPIFVELFNMSSSEDAFGIFSYETGEEEVEIGQMSGYGGGLLRFWKGKYFVNVYAEGEGPSVKEDILQLGRMIAGNIKQEGQKPKLIRLLPPAGLSERDIRYFHLHPILNHHFFISHQNLLQLGERTNAVLAPYAYAGEKGKTYLLIIQYPNKSLAEKAFQGFLKAYMPDAPLDKIIKTEAEKWTAAQMNHPYVIVVFDAPDREKAKELIEAVEKKLVKK